MLSKRVIPCLDVRNGRVVKGVQFKDHKDMGSIGELAELYADADELVFYDIGASSQGTEIDLNWVDEVAKKISIPFCVAGGINSMEKARDILWRGADKVSINTPALMDPSLINTLARELGSQSTVVGIDSKETNGEYYVHSHTGSATTTRDTHRKTKDWILEVQDRGAGEIVLNCMNQDGMRQGFDILQLNTMLDVCKVPLVASGGAGSLQDFLNVFQNTKVSAALAASVFHTRKLSVSEVREFLKVNNIPVRVI